jgi:ribose-phosphate pyrophosphokinase
MIDTGGTICQAAQHLKDEGALEIYAACTHGVLSGKAIELIEKSPIQKMIITDSIDQSHRAPSPKLEILTCAELIGEAIRRISDEESLSSLFEESSPVSQN